MTTTASELDCVGLVDATFGAVFDAIHGWRDALETAVGRGAPSVRDLDGLVERLVVPTLTADAALVIGAGFVASPGFLPDAPWHLAWWLGHANTFGAGPAGPSLRRLAAVEDAQSESFRDYTTLEWWRVPAATDAPHITGPYVDYLCTDDYTLTLTAPAHDADGRMIGVVGADLYVNDIERILLPAVRRAGRRAVLVNAAGRVVVASDGSRATGTLLRVDGLRERWAAGPSAAPGPDGRRVLPGGTTSLALVLEDELAA
jgi:hypothetical protein